MHANNILARGEGFTRRILSALWYRWRFGACGTRVVFGHNPRLINPHLIFLGNRVCVGPLCRLEVHPPNNGKASLTIGDDTFIEHGVHIYAAGQLGIGSNALIASGCMITDNNHGHYPPEGSYARQPLVHKTTIIGENVWLGENVAVLPGSTIGNNTIIGANSVVTGNIPPACIAVGSPARPIKYFDEATDKWISFTALQK